MQLATAMFDILDPRLRKCRCPRGAEDDVRQPRESGASAGSAHIRRSAVPRLRLDFSALTSAFSSTDRNPRDVFTRIAVSSLS